MNLKKDISMRSYVFSCLLIGLLFSCGTIPETETAEAGCEIQETVSYATDIVPILESNCYRCHNTEDYASKADGNLLEGYDNIKKKIDEGLVYGNIAHLPGFLKMPRRTAQIDSCDIATVKAWIDQGAPNN